jgi:hypothetical protein
MQITPSPAVKIPKTHDIVRWTVKGRGKSATFYVKSVDGESGDPVAALNRHGGVTFGMLDTFEGVHDDGSMLYTLRHDDKRNADVDLIIANKLVQASPADALYWQSDAGRATAAKMAARKVKRAAKVAKVKPTKPATVKPATVAAVETVDAVETAPVESVERTHCQACNRKRNNLTIHALAGLEVCSSCLSLDSDTATTRAARHGNATTVDAVETVASETAPVETVPVETVASETAPDLTAMAAAMKAAGFSAAEVMAAMVDAMK